MLSRGREDEKVKAETAETERKRAEAKKKQAAAAVATSIQKQGQEEAERKRMEEYTISSIQRGTFSPDFDDNEYFDDDFAGMLGWRSNGSAARRFSADASRISMSG